MVVWVSFPQDMHEPIIRLSYSSTSKYSRHLQYHRVNRFVQETVYHIETVTEEKIDKTSISTA
jgi:hypothetical protein